MSRQARHCYTLFVFWGWGTNCFVWYRNHFRLLVFRLITRWRGGGAGTSVDWISIKSVYNRYTYISILDGAGLLEQERGIKYKIWDLCTRFWCVYVFEISIYVICIYIYNIYILYNNNIGFANRAPGVVGGFLLRLWWRLHVN